MQVCFSKLSTKLCPSKSSWTLSICCWICKSGILAVEIHAKPMTFTRSVTRRSSKARFEDRVHWVTRLRRQNLKPGNQNLADNKRTQLATKFAGKRSRRRFPAQAKAVSSFGNEDVIHKDSAEKKVGLFSFFAARSPLKQFTSLHYAARPHSSNVHNYACKWAIISELSSEICILLKC